MTAILFGQRGNSMQFLEDIIKRSQYFVLIYLMIADKMVKFGVLPPMFYLY